jgi:hypothetical protein
MDEALDFSAISLANTNMPERAGQSKASIADIIRWLIEVGLEVTYRELLLLLMQQRRFCTQARGCHHFRQGAVFRLSRLIESLERQRRDLLPEERRNTATTAAALLSRALRIA